MIYPSRLSREGYFLWRNREFLIDNCRPWWYFTQDDIFKSVRDTGKVSRLMESRWESLCALPARCRLVWTRTGRFSMHGGIAVELKCKAKVMDAAAIDRTLCLLYTSDAADEL